MMISLTINRKFKLDLWSKIADELNKMGYCVGTGTNGRDRCKTKFNNLQNWFMKATDCRKRTGSCEFKKPLYHDELEIKFGDKHKANPVCTSDSTKVTNVTKCNLIFTLIFFFQ
jgi:hypothetical protein